MTKEEIIRMAREAGAKDYGTGEEGATALMLRDNAIERFAALVAAHEREECAKFCDEQYEFYGYDHVFAAGIRARGQK
jgi:hypothetical protein